MITLHDHLEWFKKFLTTAQYQHLVERPIAYFCSEYAISKELPIYAGGLGVLAGDVVKESSDQKIPLVPIGLYYFTNNTIPSLIAPVLNTDGNRLMILVPIQDHDISVQAWKLRVGNVDIYLLDTNTESNSPSDQAITQKLYVSDKETRLKQEIVLGIGGFRLLEALNIHPSIYHLNEGHSAMLVMELIKHQMQERKIGFDEALQFARRRVVFTNHTLVAAGNEVYSNDLIALMLSKYSQDLQVPPAKLVNLGLVHESSLFSMTMLSLRMAGIGTAVSQLHAKKSKEVWANHPLMGITNGIHLPTWDLISNDVAAEGKFWEHHQRIKKILLKVIQGVSGNVWSEDTLLLGWARRIVQYKRPLSIFEELEKLKTLAHNSQTPVKIVFSGLAHPDDEEGQKMVTKLKESVAQISDIAVYLPDYNLELAKLLVSGCDVWLNTPTLGFEASGTSGMKAALNGALPCSTRDGWVDEAELFKVGWILDGDQANKSFLELLEKEIVPMYYGQKNIWEEHMRNARWMIQNQFSATRMIRQYVENLYI